MKVLVINSGSSSIKYQLFTMPEAKVLVKGLLERIGEDKSNLKHTQVEKNAVKEITEKIPTHKEGMDLIFSLLTSAEYGAIKDMSEIGAVGHRVAHGGSYTESALIDDKVIKEIEAYADISPLHNPAHLIGIRACEAVLPNTKMTCVFDTSFHQTMPEYAYLYAIPYEYYEKYKIRRYGFHGTSHKFVYHKACEFLKKDKLNVITCHLGNGASVSAIKEGHSIDTSMGLSPLEGLVMGTRSGDMDTTVATYLMEKEKMSPKDMNNLLNKKSGLLGISGVSNDMRTIHEEKAKGNKRASIALDMFCYRIKKYIGAYMAALGRVDAIIFTGGIGENSVATREMIVSGLDNLGIVIDKEKNKVARELASFASANSKIELLVVATDEEKAIAIDTYNLVK